MRDNFTLLNYSKLSFSSQEIQIVTIKIKRAGNIQARMSIIDTWNVRKSDHCDKNKIKLCFVFCFNLNLIQI